MTDKELREDAIRNMQILDIAREILQSVKIVSPICENYLDEVRGMLSILLAVNLEIIDKDKNN